MLAELTSISFNEEGFMTDPNQWTKEIAEVIAKQEGIDFPIWAPYAGETKGFHTWSNARAVKAGLRFRPVEETVKDTLAWFKSQEKLEKGRTRLAGPSAEAEAKLVAAWKAARKG